MKKTFWFKAVGCLLTVGSWVYDLIKDNREYDELKNEIKKEILEDLTKGDSK